MILSWVEGYSIPFKTKPFQIKEPSVPNWSKTQIKDIKAQIAKLLDKGAIQKCEPVKDQFISDIFLVPKPDGSHRLIINLKNLNKFINTEHFKIEDSKVVINLLQPDDFMITKLENTNKCKIRDFAEFIGKLIFATNGIKYSPVYTKNFEREKFLALKKNSDNYGAIMAVNHNALEEDFSWWKSHLLGSFNPIRCFDFKLEIFTDASTFAWGANTNVESTRGYWNAEERGLHINVLELKAAFFGLRCFADRLRDCDVLLRIDNTTAISYINRMGGVQFPKLNKLAKDIWKWCESRNLWVFASYIRSKENIIADAQSRILEPETEFEISHEAFQEILRVFGSPNIDLFASRINKKCDRYISWLRDPYAFDIDAFTIDWKPFYFYAFPPFSIILKVLKKIRQDKATGIVVVPFWPTQPWYPVFRLMLIDKPLLFQPDINLLLSSDRNPHPLWDDLTLVVGRLSGEHIE